VRHAQKHGDLDADLDPAQLTFELIALLDQANSLYVLFGDTAVIERGREGIADRLRRASV
jgi:hypothetical protein